jgi:hypothetical protein
MHLPPGPRAERSCKRSFVLLDLIEQGQIGELGITKPLHQSKPGLRRQGGQGCF